ncbi:MAG TPA: trypsin-like peptidase domain-containing protein [Gaiellaceae bacterium]|nr:trypsin-like peptidase domain-containing protein [Gaiellaceae bacterium]
MSFTSLRSGAALVAAAVLGGAVAVGGVALVGGLDSTTTVITETAAAPSPGLAPASGDAMSVNEIYERASSGVVRINASDNSTSSSTSPFGQSAALGSGFVIGKSGHIVTNYHVVRDAAQVTVSFSNRDTVQAEVVGTDPSTDLAVLRVETAASALTPLSMGNSDVVRVGDPVVAIGNPFGLDRTVTAGIVSALQRLIQAPNSFTIDHVIQTDAPINPGNSGGPLLNARGQVIGVNTQIETGTGSSATGNVGIGFAVPSNTVKDVVAQILRTGRVDHAYLGISGQALTEDVAERYNLPVEAGVLVAKVTDDSGADKAGIQGGETEVVVAGLSYTLGGDVIVAFEGRKISSVEELRDAISGKKPGDKVSLVIYRDAARTSVTVTLGRQPASPQG